ncbi:hypothetical protein D9757_012525 [Collybiopsis confluens]|uniref:Alpha-type protein kinase domain-containing protein n=1 Tax=Collybiopsis confluens TaxID=2823264 RepID=A0A8H5G1P9_9AGAR|nr:hypothetical protein D9757_012525 [Collybiopsis confluens]
MDKEITVSECFLLREAGGHPPSQASGIKILAGDHIGPTEGMTWLVEPSRSTMVTKFTGTLSHGRNYIADLLSDTIHAFLHFVYAVTNGNLVFADLQGTWTSTGGKNVFVIFDPMTHTLKASSGAGDHGQKGIDSFAEDHVCGPVCEALQLNAEESSSEPSEIEESGSQTDRQRQGRKRWDPVHDDAKGKGKDLSK